MKLGALLLRGFSNQSRPKNVPRESHSKKKNWVKKPVYLLKAQQRTNSDRKAPSVQKSGIRTFQPKQEVVASTFNTLDLIRPNEKLKKSIEAFLLDQRSQHTKKAYGKDLKRFMKYLIERKMTRGTDAVDRNLIISYKDYLLSERLLHTTIDRHLATLKSFFRWLLEDGVIDRNFAENVRFLNPKRESTTKGFTNEEVETVLSLPNLYSKSGSLHYAILMVLFYCGLRRSEVCELRTSSIGFERGHHFLKLTGKGNAERIIVMTDSVWDAIQHYLKMTRKKLDQDQALFSPVRNNRTFLREKPVDSSMIFYVTTRYAKLAGIKHKVSPHSCRATAISNARDHQVPDRVIQEFAGWASPMMITRYDKRKSALEKSAVHSISYGNQKRRIPTPGEIARLIDAE